MTAPGRPARADASLPAAMYYKRRRRSAAAAGGMRGISLAYHLKGEDLLNRLVEELMGTNLLDQILAEKLEQRFAQGVKEGLEQGIERGREEGIERGLEQGLQRGRAEGERAMLRRFLEQRFGAIPAALEQRIAAADVEALATLFDQAVRAGTIDSL